MTDTPPIIPLSRIAENPRPLDTVICYEKTYSSGTRLTWKDFLDHTARVRAALSRRKEETWLLYSEDVWHFLTAFTALLQCRRKILITPNIAPAYLADIRGPETGFLTDRIMDGNSRYIPGIIAETKPEPGPMPQVNADDTDITLYTSGSTGKPKPVRQRLTEFENDNRFILSQWGAELRGRTFCSTVTHHHIYGLLFAALLPFTAGIPLKRGRIEYPEELETFTDVSYTLVTVPAFLKRAVEIHKTPLPLKSPWIFSSGGALPREIAEKTGRIFGFWPLEVYGSTETSGVAYRVSKDGPAWTPFAGADLSLNHAGCLVVRSPYIRDRDGFATGDLAEILPGGRFILKERADSIVKIEEKRVSLIEVEERILSSGLAREAAVLALESRRQFLAAVIALNDAGKTRFAGAEKREINRYFTEYLAGFLEKEAIPKKWRVVDALPLNEQGKTRKDALAALFAGPDKSPWTPPFTRLAGTETVREKTGSSVALELTVSGDCGYFDGHFPGFKLLSGAAQIELVLRFGARYLGTGLFVTGAKRLKFSHMITPDTVIRLDLGWGQTGNLAFTITSPDRKTVYSTGKLTLGNGR